MEYGVSLVLTHYVLIPVQYQFVAALIIGIDSASWKNKEELFHFHLKKFSGAEVGFGAKFDETKQ